MKWYNRIPSTISNREQTQTCLMRKTSYWFTNKKYKYLLGLGMAKSRSSGSAFRILFLSIRFPWCWSYFQIVAFHTVVAAQDQLQPVSQGYLWLAWIKSCVHPWTSHRDFRASAGQGIEQWAASTHQMKIEMLLPESIGGRGKEVP